MRRQAVTVVTLGAAQTLAWASTYYLSAILAQPMALELGVSVVMVYAAFSLAMVAAALIGARAGQAIDRLGGRPVLILSSLLFASGLAMLGAAQGRVGLCGAWLVLGLGMGVGLYEAAFATLVRLDAAQARAGITGITLMAGFASTVGWPLSAYLELHLGWRCACFVWAVAHLLVGLPLHLSLPRQTRRPARFGVSFRSRATAAEAPAASLSAPPADRPRRLVMFLLALAFAVIGFTSTAMAAHLPRLMQASGVTLGSAILVGSLIGPAQVAARLAEFGLLRKLPALTSARLACACHPLGAFLLLLGGPSLAVAFGVLHGAGNGVLTVAKGTLPLALFGAQAYGHRQGVLMIPGRFAQVGAPWLFGLALERCGGPWFFLHCAVFVHVDPYPAFAPARLHGAARQSPGGPARSAGAVSAGPATGAAGARGAAGAERRHEALAGGVAGRRHGPGHFCRHPHGAAQRFSVAGVPPGAGRRAGAHPHALRQVQPGVAPDAPAAGADRAAPGVPAAAALPQRGPGWAQALPTGPATGRCVGRLPELPRRLAGRLGPGPRCAESAAGPRSAAGPCPGLAAGPVARFARRCG